MASPGRDFDPNRKYKLVLSERLKSSEGAKEYVNSVLHVEPSLKLPATVKSAAVSNKDGGGDDVSLHVEGARPTEKYVYSGEHGPSRTAVLYFNPSTQTFTLDAVDSEFTFTQEQAARSEGSVSGDEILDSLKEQEGEADPDNPFDWRHQLRRGSASKFEPFDPISLDALRSPSPLEPVTRPKPRARPPPPRRASTPPSEIELNGNDADSDNDDDGPAVRLPPSKPASPSPVPSETPPPHPVARAASVPSSESDSDSDVGGGLEIVDDDADERPRGRRGFAHRREYLAHAGDPISLRSAANSRSPALRGYDDGVAAGIGSSGEDSDGGMRLGSPIGGRPSAAPAGAQRARAQARSSPSPSPRPQRTEPAAPMPADDEDVDMNDDDELARAFAAAEEEFGEGDDGANSTGGVPVNPIVDDSSSESEEE